MYSHPKNYKTIWSHVDFMSSAKWKTCISTLVLSFLVTTDVGLVNLLEDMNCEIHKKLLVSLYDLLDIMHLL